MKKLSASLAACVALTLTAPVHAAPPAPAVKLDDFTCMVRTLYMAGAAAQAAKNATDQAARDNANAIASESYEATSYFIGRLTISRPANLTKLRFDAEVATLSSFDNATLSDQISQCTNRSKNERAAFVTPLSGN